MEEQTSTYRNKYVVLFVPSITSDCNCWYLQKVKYSAPFFAVECKRNDILDYFMSRADININITDHVNIHADSLVLLKINDV